MSPGSDSRPRPASQAEHAFDLLERQLVTLELAPGSVVSEGYLIERLGMGRTPVREAIQRLAQQDLIRVMPRKGLLIVPIERTELLQILEVRKGLERLVVRLAALNARDDQRSRLSKIARTLATSHEDFETFLKLDRETDRRLDECAGNRFAAAAVAPLRTHCRRFWYASRHRLRLADAIAAHSAMIRLIARRDSVGAQKASDTVIALNERLAAEIE
ncbi:MAG: GntR family transcriptional regulator [Xanthomonadales bacterium]|nr:GntR family transcriptional regulator [Gammaproteobacteria bacterium]MBT8057806.1 GntR family transcriptional regulator [Gammaproteobacteria bacterium]NNL04646.1 GntR family transcriptional regulator [Xanthomonadales bacterium]